MIPHAAIPQAMFWMMVAGNFIACLGVGWLVAKTAPFAKFPHAVFLAVLLFIMFSQIVIADPPAKKRMDIIYMGALPIAILLGAKRAVDRSFEREPQAELRVALSLVNNEFQVTGKTAGNTRRLDWQLHAVQPDLG